MEDQATPPAERRSGRHHLALIEGPLLGEHDVGPYPPGDLEVRRRHGARVANDRDDLEARQGPDEGPPPHQVLGRLLAADCGRPGELAHDGGEQLQGAPATAAQALYYSRGIDPELAGRL